MGEDENDFDPSLHQGESDGFDEQLPSFQWMPLSQAEVPPVANPTSLPLLATPTGVPETPVRRRADRE